MPTGSSFKYMGTLGDSFIAFCRVYEESQKKVSPTVLKRYAQTYDDIDGPVEAFFSLFPYINYKRMAIAEGETPESASKKDPSPHIVTGKIIVEPGWDPELGEIAPLNMTPFPHIDLKQASPYLHLNSEKKIIGIQLHTGKSTLFNNKNYKGVDLAWIGQLRDALPKERYHLCLFGTGKGYSSRELELFCNRFDIQNCVGKLSFKDWLLHIQHTNLLISPDGFSAYFACSQHVPTLIFYNDPIVKVYMYPEWVAISEWVWGYPHNKWRSRLGKYIGKPYQFYRPFSIEKVLQFIDKYL